MDSKGSGFGKTILFGEHFIVYCLPGIATGLSDKTTALVEDGESGFQLIDNRPQVPGYGEKKKEEMQRQFDSIFKQFNIDIEKTPLKITLGGNLYCSSGVGASAALATSVSRALVKRLKLDMNDQQINEVAFKAESAGMGAPVSGIDNTCSVFGGFITFQKNTDGPNKIERISLENPVGIVLASTGITQVTKDVVDDVRKKKEAGDKWWNEIIGKYNDIYNNVVESIKKGEWGKVGKLMNQNQELLREIGVSCDEIEQIIKIAEDNGALGAKLTGTGRGGYVIALTPGKELQDKVANAIESVGFKILKTTIG